MAPKRLSGYQFFFEACLKEFKVKYPNSSIDLSQVSSMCADNWHRLDNETKKRFQNEADVVNIANKLPTPPPLKPIGRPLKLKKIINAAKKRFLDKAVNKVSMRPPPKSEGQQPEKLTESTKKGRQDEVVAVNKTITDFSSSPKRQAKKVKNATRERFRDQPKKKFKKETVVLKIKQPVSPFIHFAREFRSVIRRDFPDLAFGQISRKLSEMWRDADDETKTKYKRLSLKQRERYRKKKGMNSSGIPGR